MTTRGLIVGKFAPLTRGHVTFIHRAAARVDELHVMLCYDEKFLAELPTDLQSTLSLKNRHIWLLETFEQYPNVHIGIVDETHIKAYPEGAVEFTKLVRKSLSEESGEVMLTHTFSSEPSYDSYFRQFFPETKHEVIDPERQLVKISATEVRSSLYHNWQYLAQSARKDFVKSVAIIGCESTGKSTLARQLADHFSTLYVPEVGRVICEDEFYSHEEYMAAQDYVDVAFAHKEAERQKKKLANKLLISDTNNLITEFSALCMRKESNLLAQMSRTEKYDLVLYADIDVSWVGDNLRRNGDPGRRAETDAILRKLCDERKVENIVHINGAYEQRLLKAIAAINNLLGVIS